MLGTSVYTAVGAAPSVLKAGCADRAAAISCCSAATSAVHRTAVSLCRSRSRPNSSRKERISTACVALRSDAACSSSRISCCSFCSSSRHGGADSELPPPLCSAHAASASSSDCSISSASSPNSIVTWSIALALLRMISLSSFARAAARSRFLSALFIFLSRFSCSSLFFPSADLRCASSRGNEPPFSTEELPPCSATTCSAALVSCSMSDGL
mmetsp:Transcript_40164/g.99567  ORF Transcript_40164/g.99567 Transcript_40164/m.99567 type:complete len:213 (-) Transcript_40164:70-708(-)